MTKIITQTKRYFIFEPSSGGKLKHPVERKSDWVTTYRFDYNGYSSEEAALMAVRTYMEEKLSYDKDHWFNAMDYIILPVYTFSTEDV